MGSVDRAGAPRSTLIIPFVLVCSVLADRAQIAVSTGGRGALPLLVVLAPLAALATVVQYGRRRSLGFVGHAAFVLGVMPYLALTALLPVLGVMFNEYPERTLLSLADATTAFSFLVMGAAISEEEDRSWWPWLLLAMVLQLAYAAGQMVFLSGGPGWQLFTPFHQWDLSLVDLSTFVQARSSGLYLNPNELGLWAGIVVILGWSMLPRRLGGVGIVVGVVTLLLSQSRGASVALAAALVAGGALSVARGRLGAGALRAVLYFGLAGLLAIAVALVLGPPGELGARFGAMIQVLTQGPGADPNLSGRLDYWAAVVDLNAVYPWGTWGSPELLLGSAVDSSWFRAFAQGSVLYVTTMVLLIGASLTVGEFRHRQALRMVAVLVAVAGLTQTPFSYPSIILFWVLLGAGLQWCVDSRASTHLTSRLPATLVPGSATGTHSGIYGPAPAGRSLMEVIPTRQLRRARGRRSAGARPRRAP